MRGDVNQALAAHLSPTYRVDGEIGRGGWGLVYLAHDLRHDRTVAIKILRQEFTGSVSVQRFRREIDFLTRLDHPNIVSLYDAGALDGLPWYAMSYVQGETLRERVAREGQLAIPESIRIARETAAALAHAHAAGVVHRDVKPGNIILDGDRVMIVDFGVARAMSQAATTDALSSSGVLIGTPTYMSPEQVNAAPDIDGRSDIYSLGCVLYEMLAGSPPFSSGSAAAVTARHVLDPVPPLATVRSSVSPGLADIVYKMLAKAPVDRFATAGEVEQALNAASASAGVSVVADRRRATLRRRSLIACTAAAVVVAGTWIARVRLVADADARALAAVDTTRLVVFPFTQSGAPSSASDADGAMRQGLVRWTGVNVVDPFALSDAMRGERHDDLSASEARTVAIALHAARYVRGSVVREGDRWRAHAMLLDVGRGETPLAEVTTVMPTSATTEGFARIADALLFRGSDSLTLASSSGGTTSLPARQAYLRGQAALERWNLATADTAFAAATQFDAHFASASLWLALTRLWAEKDTATWHYAAAAAAAGRSSLSAQDQAKVDALALLTAGDRPAACAAWDHLTKVDRFDFAGWYGAAQCLHRDLLVVPDSRSPSGWRFRSGLHSALIRYRRAFELRPAVLGALRDDAFRRVRQLFWTSGMDVRTGKTAPPDSRYYHAFPSLQDDTLAFVPFSAEVLGSSDSKVLAKLPSSIGAAVQRQRAMLRDVATGWVAAQPKSSAAHEALAIAMQQMGEASAIDTIVNARALATDARERARVRQTEVWLRVEFALPADIKGLRTARALADSVLRERGVGDGDPQTFASMAALTGRAFDAAKLAGERPFDAIVPGIDAVKRAAQTLVIYAAFGGPVDSLRQLDHRIDSLTRALVQPGQRAAARVDAMERAAMLAFPDVALPSIQSLQPGHLPLLSAEVALQRGDTAGARMILARLAATRKAFAVLELTLDAVYPEAWLLSATGDSAAAIAWLDPTLARLRLSSSLVDPVRAAVLVRAMAFRAELASRTGDARTAKLWASAVVELWSGGDAFIQPLVARMRKLAR